MGLITSNFWCQKCRKDWTLVAMKKTKSSYIGEVLVARCPDCKMELVRFMNNPNDPYYRLSKRLKVERKKYAKDLLQVGDPGFDLLYPQHKKKREAYYENLEKQIK